jgi:hypothetical protein
VLRPSILDEQLFGTSAPGSQRRVRSRGFSLGDDVFQNNAARSSPNQAFGALFAQPTVAPGMATAPEMPNYDPPTAAASTSTPQLLPSATFDPPRLGSPFSESGSSQTFPRRLFPDATATVRRSAFATMHQTRRSIESFDFGEGVSLQSRLSTLDNRLREIRERDVSSQQQNFE